MNKRIVVATVLATMTNAICAIDINQASEMELDGIKGIGPALSGRVLQERSKGEFRDWRDLLGRVKGLGSVQASRLSAQGLTVGGVPFKTAAAPPTPAPQTPSDN